MTDQTVGAQPEGATGPPAAELATRGFIGRPWPTILAATFAGLFAMSLSFMVALPILVSMVALFAGILLVFGFRTGDMRYRLTADGLQRSFRPLAARFFHLPGREQTFRFDQMRFYRRDRDWSRYRVQEVESLTIGVRRPPYRIVIHDMIDKAEFGAFADRFEQLAARDITEIPRKPGFYQSVWAMLLTALFAVIAVVLILLFAIGMLNPTGIFRLLVVIIPGVIYMAWRVTAAHRRSSD
ncbi:MAG: hypothetical protein GY798_01575 [Hyphomicrobiales bacterium]|nr:hypothetical protein [Hyphomicrobiales bacterium]